MKGKLTEFIVDNEKYYIKLKVGSYQYLGREYIKYDITIYWYNPRAWFFKYNKITKYSKRTNDSYFSNYKADSLIRNAELEFKRELIAINEQREYMKKR